MRIVHLSTIHQAFDIRIFMKECRTLAAFGYDVHLIVQNPPVSQKEGVKFWSLDIDLSAGKFKQFCQRYTQICKIAWQLNANIYHFHDPELILLGLFLKLKGAYVIYDVHEDAPREAISLNKKMPIWGYTKYFVFWLLETFAKRLLDAFVCVTPSIKSKFPTKKSWLIQNFPLVEEIQAYRQPLIDYPERHHKLIYVGGISEIRGIYETIEALSQLPDDTDCQLLLLGKFSPLSLRFDLEKHNGWRRVEYMGWCDRNNMIQHMRLVRAGLVLFHPEVDHREAIPNKLFEYMAAGLPIIASDFPKWQQIIHELNCGLVVNPLDPMAIVSAIQYILDHPKVAQTMGENGRNAVIEKFNWSNEARNLLKLYNSIELPQNLS